MGEVPEVIVPKEHLQDRKLVLTSHSPTDEDHLNWRLHSRLAEVWLLAVTYSVDDLRGVVCHGGAAYTGSCESAPHRGQRTGLSGANHFEVLTWHAASCQSDFGVSRPVSRRRPQGQVLLGSAN
jgi:hypothetical protein